MALRNHGRPFTNSERIRSGGRLLLTLCGFAFSAMSPDQAAGANVFLVEAFGFHSTCDWLTDFESLEATCSESTSLSYW